MVKYQCISQFKSPLGPMEICSTSKGISAIRFVDNTFPGTPKNLDQFHTQCHVQLDRYFQGSLESFDLTLDFRGTDFQLAVWNELLSIPAGQTVSYSEIAHRLGVAGSERAVGRTNGLNPIAIVVPCHRVIGANGSLVGYAGGLERKEWLLRHEGALAQLSLFSNHCQ